MIKHYLCLEATNLSLGRGKKFANIGGNLSKTWTGSKEIHASVGGSTKAESVPKTRSSTSEQIFYFLKTVEYYFRDPAACGL